MKNTNKTNTRVIVQNVEKQMTKSGVAITGVAHNDGTCYFNGFTACTGCGACNTI